MRWTRLEDIVGRPLRGYDALIDECGAVRVRTWFWNGVRRSETPRELVPSSLTDGRRLFVLSACERGPMVFRAETIGKWLLEHHKRRVATNG